MSAVHVVPGGSRSPRSFMANAPDLRHEQPRRAIGERQDQARGEVWPPGTDAGDDHCDR